MIRSTRIEVKVGASFFVTPLPFQLVKLQQQVLLVVLQPLIYSSYPPYPSNKPSHHGSINKDFLA